MAKREAKYLVIKLQDMDEYFAEREASEKDDPRYQKFKNMPPSLRQRAHFEQMLQGITGMRERKGKKPSNDYVVINQDEPYASAVWDIVIAFENEKEKK